MREFLTGGAFGLMVIAWPQFAIGFHDLAYLDVLTAIAMLLLRPAKPARNAA